MNLEPRHTEPELRERVPVWVPKAVVLKIRREIFERKQVLSSDFGAGKFPAEARSLPDSFIS